MTDRHATAPPIDEMITMGGECSGSPWGQFMRRLLDPPECCLDACRAPANDDRRDTCRLSPVACACR